METRIGEVFREARRRRQVDLGEVEAATRIRPRYLRAIEAEEWDVLPGEFYTRGFIRAYASFLGLDGERLVEDYREGVEGASREWTPAQEAGQPASPAPDGSPSARRRRRSVPAAGWLAAAGVVAVAVVTIVALPGGDGGGEQTGPGKHSPAPRPTGTTDLAKHGRPAATGVSVRLAAQGEVWVCVLDVRGRHLVDGRILEGGAEAGPFHSGSFTVSFGNGEVSMTIDGKKAEIPPTSSPIGYAIDSSGKLIQLSEAERPTCA